MVDLAIAFPARGIPSTRRLMEYARASERAGFVAAFIPEAVTDSMAGLQAMAMATERIKIGSGIANIYLRHPCLQAMTAQTIDELSDGRLILGLGISHKGIVEGRFGIPFGPPADKPRQRLIEYVAVLRQAFTGHPVTFSGEFYRVQDWQSGLPVTRPQIPIYLAVLGLKMARLAGEIADGVILNLAAVDHTRRVIEAVRDGARAAGRDPASIEIASFIACCIDEDRELARDTARRIISFYSTMPFYGKV
jgi:5,10-methylenetetrahydromethanopterin reductase